MKKISIIILLACVVFSACKIEKIQQLAPETKPMVNLVADFETDPVSSDDDAADDPAVWVHPTDAMKSTIIGTNKREGLVVYDLNGKELYNYPIGRVNNVDVREFVLNGKPETLVMSTKRNDNTITAHIVNKETGELIDIQARPLQSNLKKIYGFGMYKSPTTGKVYALPNDKNGKVEQWELFENNGKVDGKIVRTFDVGSQVEGIVADDFHAKLYIGEENKALWKYDAEPSTDIKKRIQVIGVKGYNMKADFEGVTIYDAGNGKGYIILSSQGNNSYAVFDRVTNQYIGSFRLVDGNGIDGTYDTDGIDVTSRSFGTKYPKGFFIAQDGANTKEKDTLNQNFKVIDWQKIANALKLKH